MRTEILFSTVSVKKKQSLNRENENDDGYNIHHNHDLMVVGFATQSVIHHWRGNSVPASVKVYTMQDLTKFVNDDAGGFPRELWFPPPKNLTATIKLKEC